MNQTADATAVICRIYERTILISDVCPDDDLFDLGGHSLHAAQILKDVIDRYGATIPLADFLDEPTPRGLADLVAAKLETV